jgi:hypothetical protein
MYVLGFSLVLIWYVPPPLPSHLAAREKGRLRLLKTGLIDRLMEICDRAAPQSLAAVLCLHCLVAFAFPCARGPAEVRFVALSVSWSEYGFRMAALVRVVVHTGRASHQFIRDVRRVDHVIVSLIVAGDLANCCLTDVV